MYFRDERHISIWRIDRKGNICKAVPFGQLPTRQKNTICPSRQIPDEWLMCNGLILPENYVDVHLFEKIYRTHNCFRTFAGAGKKQTSSVSDRMAEVRGVLMDDLEARRICIE